MSRTILIHLNIEASDSDSRTADEITDYVLASLEVGLEGDPGSLASGSELAINDLLICNALSEEV